MNKRYGSILIVSVTILVLCLVGTASATTWTVDDNGGDADFTGIQDAINKATDGDTIIVHSGLYYENVVVDKSVTLKGIGHPVVDARGWRNAITLTADGITLEGFSITNAGRPFYSGYMISIICPIDSSGIFLDNSRNNKITNNKVIGNTYGGICLDNSSNNTITGNNVSNNNVKGIWLYDSSNNNNITGNNVSNNDDGICLHYSSNNTITGNNASNNGEGIGLSYSSNNNTITGNSVYNNWDGIRLFDSSNNNNITGNNVYNNNWGGINLSFFSNNNTITGNTFVNDGLSISSSYQNTVEGNTVNDKPLVYLEDVSDYKVEDAGQIILRNCTNITVENLDLSNTSVGIELLNTKDSNILNNTVCNNRGCIGLSYSSNNNTITGNNVNNNEHGISLDYSSNNTITGNNASNNNDDGISLDYSSNNNTITGNNVRNNADGISLSSSCNNNTITGNTFVNDGLSVHDSYQNTVKNNTVNGKPLVYLKDVSDYKVEDAGQVILVNCNNITVENLVLSNTSVGVHLLKTRNCRISNNTLCNNGEGIYLGDSSNNNIITGNNVGNNRKGIYLYYSSNNNTITGNNNTITGNNVCNNSGEGIYLFFSSKNKITGNNVRENRKGIELYDSGNNKIYFNNFINNTDNAYSYDASTTIWNSPLEITYTYDGRTYKSYVGNYWDDYKGTDAEGDGIGDTRHNTYYIIFFESDASDDHPLMQPFENYILATSAPA